MIVFDKNSTSLAPLFSPTFSDVLKEELPVLFHTTEIDFRRGDRVRVGLGSARKREIIDLIEKLYGDRTIEYPNSTYPSYDVKLCGEPIQVRTKSSAGYSGVQLSWVSGNENISRFIENFEPKYDILYVNIIPNQNGGYFAITQKAQQETFELLGPDKFFTVPKKSKNPRGVTLSAEAMKHMQKHKDTLKMTVFGERDSSIDENYNPYERWVGMWENL